MYSANKELRMALEQIFGKANVTTQRGVVVSKKILNRSIFVVPTTPTVRPNCPNGFTLNSKGKCEEILEIDGNSYYKFVLKKIANYNYDDADYEDYSESQYKNSIKNDKKRSYSTRFSIPVL